MRIQLRSLNLIGVLVLAVMSGIQWRANRAANLALLDLEKIRQSQGSTLAEQAQTVQGLQLDLSTLREHMTATHATLKDSESKLRQAELSLAQQGDKASELKASITQWAGAVAERDARLAQTAEQLEHIVRERAELAGKYNELAERHNGIVHELNSRTRDLNAWVERYNSLAKSAQGASGR